MQVVLFPLEVLHITQGMDNPFSHAGSFAVDFKGTTVNAQLYAPCDMMLVARSWFWVAYTSLRPVKFANGNSGYFTIWIIHDDDQYFIPRTVLQGYPLAKTGTAGNATGDHVHIETKVGIWEGQIQNSEGVWMMKNSAPPTEFFVINDTTIIEDNGYPWGTFSGGYPFSPYGEGLPIWML